MALSDIKEVFYQKGSTPALDQSKDKRIEQELLRIGEAINELNTNIMLLKEHLETP